MRALILSYLAFVRFFKRVCSRPAAVRARQDNAAEQERLDRLRNPSKYLGKP